MKRTPKKNELKRSAPRSAMPEATLENTGSILIRAAASMERFDAQLERSKKVVSQVRRELAEKAR